VTSLAKALQQFEAAESNLDKLEKLWKDIRALLPEGPAFGAPEGYDTLCRAFRGILPSLPAIDGFRVEDRLLDYDEVGQMRLDALDLDELSAKLAVDRAVEEQGEQLSDYRYRLDRKRSEMIRQRVLDLVDEIDDALVTLVPLYETRPANTKVENPYWDRMKEAVSEIDALFGSMKRPINWGVLIVTLVSIWVVDLLDIKNHDWPAAKTSFAEGTLQWARGCSG